MGNKSSALLANLFGAPVRNEDLIMLHNLYFGDGEVVGDHVIGFSALKSKTLNVKSKPLEKYMVKEDFKIMSSLFMSKPTIKKD